MRTPDHCIPSSLGWTWGSGLTALGWGAGLVLRIFLALLPILLRLMGRVQGLFSESMLDFSVVTKYYIFQARAALPSIPQPLLLAGTKHTANPVAAGWVCA